MDFKITRIGKAYIELHVSNRFSTLVDDITDINGIVSNELIQNLEDIIDELKKYNSEKNEGKN